ncbi:hypothetical protein [Listeria fleischmannii]|nr:hypothetical protein [Listeria fleischmannii]
MMKEALQYLVKLGNRTEVVEVNGRSWVDDDLNEVVEKTPAPLEVSTLTGLVDYIKSFYDSDENLLLVVESPTRVVAKSGLNGDKVRNHYITAKAEMPRFEFDAFHNLEYMNINLQAAFLNDEKGHKDLVLKVIGNVTEEEVKNYNDDGTTQQVTAKTGVATVGGVVVPNPVELTPYRTFAEAEQPTSQFIFRFREGMKAGFV